MYNPLLKYFVIIPCWLISVVLSSTLSSFLKLCLVCRYSAYAYLCYFSCVYTLMYNSTPTPYSSLQIPVWSCLSVYLDILLFFVKPYKKVVLFNYRKLYKYNFYFWTCSSFALGESLIKNCTLYG